MGEYNLYSYSAVYHQMLHPHVTQILLPQESPCDKALESISQGICL